MRLNSLAISRLSSRVICCLPLRGGGMRLATTGGIAAFILSMRSICVGTFSWMTFPSCCSALSRVNHESRVIVGIQHRHLKQAYLRVLHSFGRQGNLIRCLIPDCLVHAQVVAPGGGVIVKAHERLRLASAESGLRQIRGPDEGACPTGLSILQEIQLGVGYLFAQHSKPGLPVSDAAENEGVAFVRQILNCRSGVANGDLLEGHDVP